MIALVDVPPRARDPRDDHVRDAELAFVLLALAAWILLVATRHPGKEDDEP